MIILKITQQSLTHSTDLIKRAFLTSKLAKDLINLIRKGYDLAPISGDEGWVPMYLHD